MKFSKLLLIAVLFFFASCSNPLEKAYNEDSLSEDLLSISKKVGEKDAQILVGQIAMSAFSEEENPYIGKTYGTILKEAKERIANEEAQEKEEAELAAKAKKEADERAKKINEALTVSIFEKNFTEGSITDYITFKFAFENKTDKAITAFTGTVFFKDLFDKDIKNLSLTYDEGVDANSTKNYDASIEYNEFDDANVLLKTKELDKIKVIWIPEKVIFDDDSTL